MFAPRRWLNSGYRAAARSMRAAGETARAVTGQLKSDSESLGALLSRFRFQFTLRTMFVAFTLFSVLFALLGGLVAGIKWKGNPADVAPTGDDRLALFVLLTVAAPLVIVLATGMIRPVRQLLAWVRSMRERRNRDEP